MDPPAAVWRAAFSTRFTRTCLRRPRSPGTVKPGSTGDHDLTPGRDRGHRLDDVVDQVGDLGPRRARGPAAPRRRPRRPRAATAAACRRPSQAESWATSRCHRGEHPIDRGLVGPESMPSSSISVMRRSTPPVACAARARHRPRTGAGCRRSPPAGRSRRVEGDPEAADLGAVIDRPAHADRPVAGADAASGLDHPVERSEEGVQGQRQPEQHAQQDGRQQSHDERRPELAERAVAALERRRDRGQRDELPVDGPDTLDGQERQRGSRAASTRRTGAAALAAAARSALEATGQAGTSGDRRRRLVMTERMPGHITTTAVSRPDSSDAMSRATRRTSERRDWTIGRGVAAGSRAERQAGSGRGSRRAPPRPTSASRRLVERERLEAAIERDAQHGHDPGHEHDVGDGELPASPARQPAPTRTGGRARRARRRAGPRPAQPRSVYPTPRTARISVRSRSPSFSRSALTCASMTLPSPSKS